MNDNANEVMFTAATVFSLVYVAYLILRGLF